MKASSNATTPRQYLDALGEPRKSQIAELDALIRKTAPSLTPFVHAGMLAYGPYHYVYESGREGGWFVVGLSSRKNYISLYVCAVADGKYLAENYKKQLPKASIGKSCIRFKKPEEVDAKVLKEILKKAEAWAKGQAGFRP